MFAGGIKVTRKEARKKSWQLIRDIDKCLCGVPIDRWMMISRVLCAYITEIYSSFKIGVEYLLLAVILTESRACVWGVQQRNLATDKIGRVASSQHVDKAQIGCRVVWLPDNGAAIGHTKEAFMNRQTAARVIILMTNRFLHTMFQSWSDLTAHRRGRSYCNENLCFMVANGINREDVDKGSNKESEKDRFELRDNSDFQGNNP